MRSSLPVTRLSCLIWSELGRRFFALAEPLGPTYLRGLRSPFSSSCPGALCHFYRWKLFYCRAGFLFTCSKFLIGRAPSWFRCLFSTRSKRGREIQKKSRSENSSTEILGNEAAIFPLVLFLIGSCSCWIGWDSSCIH